MTVNRYKFRPGTPPRIGITGDDCERDGRELTSQLTESIFAAALARDEGDVERAKLHQEAAFRVLLEAQRQNRQTRSAA